MSMGYFGCHLSISQGLFATGKTAAKINANTFAYFTRNPRGGKTKPIDTNDIDNFLKFARDNSFGPVVAHASYTMNVCSAKQEVRQFARKALCEDIERMQYTPDALYNFHPGSHTGQGAKTAITQIAQALDEASEYNKHIYILLETMAGKGTEVGHSFEELADILAATDAHEKLGVCLDTCHVWDAGYDIKNHLDEVLDEFDKIIGLNRLKALHLNDSKNPCGSHKDRHEKLGKGQLGLETFKRIVTHPVLSCLPMILETPQDSLEGYAAEIKLLRDFAEGKA